MGEIGGREKRKTSGAIQITLRKTGEKNQGIGRGERGVMREGKQGRGRVGGVRVGVRGRGRKERRGSQKSGICMDRECNVNARKRRTPKGVVRSVKQRKE